MRTALRVVVVAAALIMTSVLSIPRAFSCSCLPVPALEDWMADADAAYVVRPTQAAIEQAASHGPGDGPIDLPVLRVFHGPQRETLPVRVSHANGTCAFGLRDEEYLVPVLDGEAPSLSVCSTYAQGAEIERAERLFGPSVPVASIDAARSRPWLLIGSAALAILLVGYAISRLRSRTRATGDR